MNAKDFEKKTSWAEMHDKASKNHLTQMQTIGSTAVAHRGGSIKPPLRSMAESQF